MTFAGSFDDLVLPPDHRAALETACTVLVDDFLDDMSTLSDNPEAWDETYMSGYLPRRSRDGYTPVFAREFLVCTVVVGWKVAQDPWPGLACLGEELALNALVEAAAIRLEDDGADPDFRTFLRRALAGAAFADLFVDAPGGVDESELGRRLQRSGLPVEGWFSPFPGLDAATLHPYLVGPVDFPADDDAE
ncbi:MAG TPA: hypothetical protein VMU89_03995 [Thermomicrobiaceae bacterium]|nr:hypothetical protein [Thermomicrobiaceae bacterium]